MFVGFPARRIHFCILFKLKHDHSFYMSFYLYGIKAIFSFSSRFYEMFSTKKVFSPTSALNVSVRYNFLVLLIILEIDSLF